MNQIKQLFSDDKGNISSMRFLSIFTVMTVLITWSVLSIKNNQIISFDYKDLGVLLAAFGGKSLQKFIEINGLNKETKEVK